MENRKDTGKRKILIVEQDKNDRELLTSLLSFEYCILEASDSMQGIRLLQEEYQEIVMAILDVQTSREDGTAFLEQVQRDPLLRHIPVIAAAGDSSVEEEERWLDLGASDFITKPYSRNIVRFRVKNIVRLRESAATISAIEYDELTGVYTRQAFYHHAEKILKSNPEKRYRLIVSDIDDFKTINEKYGEDFGNHMLAYIASMLRRGMNLGFPVGRYAGDQFVSLIEARNSITDEDSIHGFQEELRKSFPVPGLEIRIGICDVTDHRLPVAVLCDRALIAVRSISHQYGKYVAYYDRELQEKIRLRERLELDMEKAYDEAEFQVYYQPKHDTLTGRLVGAEALIRWQHPELGFLSPAVFVPLFEKNGFITYADYYVWTRTCHNLKRWKDKGIRLVPVSVNTSRKDYEYPNYVDMVLRPVRECGIDPALLHIEVTESAFAIHPELMNEKLEAMRKAGFQIELDDFGTGYSSMNILGTLPLDVMKLDMSFMVQIHNVKKARILASCITLAKSLGMRTIAEGVETEEQRNLLSSLRCDTIQGYYYSTPLSEDDFEEYMLRYEQQEDEGVSLPEETANESGMYVIDEDYNVVMLNDRIRELYPSMHTGEKCYRCLMNLDHPCDICPVKNKIWEPKEYIDPIRNVYEMVQVVKVPLTDGRNGYALVLYTLT